MDGVKFILSSRTVIASLIGLLATIAKPLGFGDIDAGQLTEAVLSVVQGASFIAAILFRAKADTKVALTPPK